MLYNYHTHTTFCDGKTPAEEMVQKAIEFGLSELGFSGHSYTPFDLEPCMTLEGTEEYKKQINSLKEKYKDKIKILLGIEYEYYSDCSLEGYDYILGSVHYLYKNVQYFFLLLVVFVQLIRFPLLDYLRLYFEYNILLFEIIQI